MTFRAAFLCACLTAIPVIAKAQAPKKPVAPAARKPVPAGAKTGVKPATPRAPVRRIPDGVVTTLSGVYTLEEASAGKEMYAGLCAGCHTAASHTGPAFRKKWAARPLSELFTFMRTMMPKNEPASLSDEDYGVLLAYMLQMNRMPAGKTYLSTDPSELAKIWIDTARAVAVRKPI